MIDTPGSRVPFTYHSLLYKLDNIHLKQTHHGKPYIHRRIRTTETITVNSLGGRARRNNITAKGIKANYSENEKSQHLFQDSICNGYIDASRCLPNNKFDKGVLYDDDDSDTASDLSIDGAVVNNSSVLEDCQVGNDLQVDGPVYSKDGLTNIQTNSEISEISEEWRDKPKNYKGKKTSLYIENDNKESDTCKPQFVLFEPGPTGAPDTSASSVRTDLVSTDILATSDKYALVTGETTPDGVSYTTKEDISIPELPFSTNRSKKDGTFAPSDITYSPENENSSKTLHFVHGFSPESQCQSDVIDKLVERNNMGTIEIDELTSSKIENLSIDTPTPLDKSDVLSIDTPTPLDKFNALTMDKQTPLDTSDVVIKDTAIPLDKSDVLSIDTPTPPDKYNVLTIDKLTPLGKSDIVIKHSSTPLDKSDVPTMDTSTLLDASDVPTMDTTPTLDKSDIITEDTPTQRHKSDVLIMATSTPTDKSNVVSMDTLTPLAKSDVPTKETLTPLDKSDIFTKDTPSSLGKSDVFTMDKPTQLDKSDVFTKDTPTQHNKVDVLTMYTPTPLDKTDVLTMDTSTPLIKSDFFIMDTPTSMGNADVLTMDTPTPLDTSNVKKKDESTALYQHDAVQQSLVGFESDISNNQNNSPNNFEIKIDTGSVKMSGNVCNKTGESVHSHRPQILKETHNGTRSVRLRQTGKFVKEYDNSISLISDLLLIGSSSNTSRNRVFSATFNSNDKISDKTKRKEEVVGQEIDYENKVKDRKTKKKKENENSMTLDDKLFEDNILQCDHHGDAVETGTINPKPRMYFSSSFPKLQKSTTQTAAEHLSKSVDKECTTKPRIDWTFHKMDSSKTNEVNQKIKPQIGCECEIEAIGIITENSTTGAKHVLKTKESNCHDNWKDDAKGQRGGKFNSIVFDNDAEDTEKSTEDNRVDLVEKSTGHVRDNYNSYLTDASLVVMNNNVKNASHHEEENTFSENDTNKSTPFVSDCQTKSLQEHSGINLNDGSFNEYHADKDSEDSPCTAEKLHDFECVNLKEDGDTKTDQANDKIENDEFVNDKTAVIAKTESGNNNIIPITIKRLPRPEKSKSNQSVDPKEKLDPSSSLQFIFSDKSAMSGFQYDKSEYPTQKMVAETLANLPIITGKTELACPTCGEQVLNTGKRETDCVSPVHRLLLKIPSLQSIADEYNLTVRNIAGDGNCMFSAVIDQLKIAGDFRFTKHSLRSTAVDYLREHPHQEDGSHLESFLSKESWEEYLTRMNRDGEWGDHMVLNGITEVIGRHVTVLSTSGNAIHLVPRNTMTPDDQTLDSIYLGHVGGTHYVSLRPKDWEEMWPINARIRRLRQYSEDSEDCTRRNANLEASNNYVGESELHINHSVSEMTTEENILLKNYFEVDGMDVSECLATDIQFIDPVSRIPMIHFSFILNLLLRLMDFVIPYSRALVPTDGATIELESVGSSSEKMDVCLINQTKSGCSRFNAISENYGYTTQVAFWPSSSYNVLTCDYAMPEISHGQGVVTMVTEIEDTHEGYLRLRSIGCSCCQKHMGISRYVNGKWYVSDLQVKLEAKNIEKHKYLQGLRCSYWPDQAREWIFRERRVQWPQKEVIDKIQKNGCYIVHRSHACSREKDIEFQFLFSQTEKLLIQEHMTEDMKYCFYIFKALVEFQTKNLNCKLSTYHLKTTLFYACELIPSDTWHSSCGGSVMFMVDLLLKWLRNRNLPNYFIKGNNMIDNWKNRDVNKLCDQMETLRLFPCMVLHFLSENNGLTHSWLIDSVMSSSKKFKENRNVHSVIENTFNPTTFFFADEAVTHTRNYEHALTLLNEAFERNLVWSGQSINFREFIDEFLLTVNGKKAKRAFTEFVDGELNTNLDSTAKEAISYEKFLGSDYKGKYGKRLFKSSVDPWKSLTLFISSLLSQLEYEEIVKIARCVIDKCKKDLGSSVVDVSEIDDEELKKQVTKSNNDVTKTLVQRTIRYYNLLCICYRSMNKVELALDIMYEYQEAVEKIPSKYYFKDICEMWVVLNCPEKVEEIESKMSNLLDNEDESFNKNVFSILFI